MENFNEEYNEDYIREFKAQTEVKFFKMVENKEDVSLFLYLPHDMISEKIKDYLDEYLIVKAIDLLDDTITKMDDKCVVYEDGFMRVSIPEEKGRIELLTRVLEYLIKHERYEECIKFQNNLNILTKKLQDKNETI